MAWINVILSVPEDQAFLVSECLFMAGAVSVSLEDAKDSPLFEPEPGTHPLWEITKVIGLFESTIDIPELQLLLKKILPAELLKDLTIEPLEEKDWLALSVEAALPLKFGKHLWLRPSTERSDPETEPDRIEVILDPGYAFGTGKHATTKLCLEWLDALSPLSGTLIDYGCGSGILAIAALKLGINFAYAIDHDPQALISTGNNAGKNALTDKNLQIILPQDLKLSSPVDYLVSNILIQPLIALAPTFTHYLKPKGRIILSGILGNQKEEIISAYSSYFETFETTQEEGWIAITAIKK